MLAKPIVEIMPDTPAFLVADLEHLTFQIERGGIAGAGSPLRADALAR